MKTLAILTSHDEDFDFEYVQLVKGLTRHYKVHVICHTKYKGALCTLDVVLHHIDCKSKLDFQAIKKMRMLIKTFQFDIIYTQTNRLLAISILSTYFLSQVPASFVRRGICAPVYKYRIEDYLTYFSQRLKHVITISNAAKKSLSDGGFQNTKITTIHPALDENAFNKDVDHQLFRQNNNIPLDAILVMSIANKRHIKGLDRVLAAADKLKEKNIYWCLIGWGCDQRLLDDLKRDKPEKVRLLGFLEDAFQYLSACDIYVQASRMEGLSYSLMQAILKGCCPVISKTGGMAELVEDRYNGLTFDNNDQTASDDLSSLVMELIEKPNLRSALALKGPEKLSRDFSHKKMLEKTISVFEQYS